MVRDNRPFHKSTNWTQKSIQIGKTDTADYGDSKLIKLFSFNYKGMILLLPSQRTIEGRQVLSSVEVTAQQCDSPGWHWASPKTDSRRDQEEGGGAGLSSSGVQEPAG